MNNKTDVGKAVSLLREVACHNPVYEHTFFTSSGSNGIRVKKERFLNTCKKYHMKQ